MRWQGQLKRAAAGLLLLTGLVTVGVGAYMLYIAHAVATVERRVVVPLPTEEPLDTPPPVAPTPTPLTPYTPTPSYAPATTLAAALTPPPMLEPIPEPTPPPLPQAATPPPATPVMPVAPAPAPTTLAPLPPTPPPPMPMPPALPSTAPPPPTHTPIPPFIPPPLPTHTPLPLPPTHAPAPVTPITPKAPPPTATRAPNVVVVPLGPAPTTPAASSMTAAPTPIIIVLTTLTPFSPIHTIAPTPLTPPARLPTSTPPTLPTPITRTPASSASLTTAQPLPPITLTPTPMLPPKPSVAAALPPPIASGPSATGILRSGLGAATNDSSGHEPVWGGKQYVHILLLGLDRRNDTEPTRSDTMILATVNLWDGAVSLLSIPRDLLVPIPGHGEDRVNTAFAYGQAAHPNDPAAGPALAVKTVSRQFNMPIEHYLFVDFAGFREIVDGVGGVEITVPTMIDDPQYPTDDYGGVTHLHFDPGTQHMNGDRALAYARTRHAAGDDDNERRERQMQVMQAVLIRALQIDSVRTLPVVVKRLGNNMQTSLPYDAQLSLVKMGHKIGASGVAQYSIRPPLVRPSVTPAGAEVYLGDWIAIRPLVLEAIDPKRKAKQR